jgi:hypothetical protein
VEDLHRAIAHLREADAGKPDFFRSRRACSNICVVLLLAVLRAHIDSVPQIPLKLLQQPDSSCFAAIAKR